MLKSITPSLYILFVNADASFEGNYTMAILSNIQQQMADCKIGAVKMLVINLHFACVFVKLMLEIFFYLKNKLEVVVEVVIFCLF